MAWRIQSACVSSAQRKHSSIPTSTTCTPLLRLMIQTPWERLPWCESLWWLCPSAGSNKRQQQSKELRGTATERLLRWWKILVEWKERSRIWQCVVPRTSKILVWEKTWIILKEKPGELGESIAHRKLSETEMDWHRMTWDGEILIGRVSMETTATWITKIELNMQNNGVVKLKPQIVRRIDDEK